ncbi:MAG TPA: alpha/beta hydrolase-fold protein [Chthonomonadaceae bacterium]|nr:alpha/beta hydrolase-fold protein [Chthonomonadaceae bacterium]
MNIDMMLHRIAGILIPIVGLAAAACAQPPAPGREQPPPPVVSPEVSADRRLTLRLFAPQAQAVRLTGSDIPGVGPGVAMTKGENGVWEVTLGPLDPGAYRYTFNVDGVPVVDPRSPSVSESNNNVWSLVYVPGSDFMDTKDVPHGAVASVTYYSTALGKFRRMHVYTPPGYEQGKGKYPVFYLLHGASDSDDAWPSVGRAGFILDNLIAAGKAKPMIVVMPAGHTRPFGGFTPPRPGSPPPVDEFVQDFVTDIMPYVEKNYRTLNDRQNRAIAGLSMGGSQTLNIAIPHLDKFAYIGVYSSGLFGIVGPPRPAGSEASAAPANAPFPWEEQHRAELDDANLKKGLKLLWFSTGKDDFLLATTKATVDLFKKHGFDVVYAESPGGHTWINWRNYLIEFAPKLFR